MTKVVEKIETYLEEGIAPVPKEFQYQFPDWKEVGQKYIQKIVNGLSPLIKKKYKEARVTGNYSTGRYIGTTIQLNTKWVLEVRWAFNERDNIGYIEPVIAQPRKGSGQIVAFSNIKDLWENVQAHIKRGY